MTATLEGVAFVLACGLLYVVASHVLGYLVTKADLKARRSYERH
mgnify:CR=1 FL=1